MNQKEAEEVYLGNLKRTEDVIDSMSDNPQAINTFITNTYALLSQKDPAFLWFQLAAVVSGSVGKNIQMAIKGDIYSLGQVESSNIVHKAFSEGNQAIFKNILPIYLTYDSIGIEGCEQLSISSFGNPFQEESTLSALRIYALLQEKQEAIANKLGLPVNHAKVIEELISEKSNIELMHTVAKGVAFQEQNKVQDIYEDKFVDVLLDPKLGWAGHQFKLDEIKILDKSYNFFDYIDNPADFDQRMAFAEILLTAIEDGISNGLLSQHQADVADMAKATLWMGNPYTKADLIGDVNGVVWGQQADEHDKKVLELVQNFINPEKTAQGTPIASPIDMNDNDIFASAFNGANKIVKVEVDPLAFFLATNPNYEVIANNVTELLSSTAYNRAPLYGGVALYHPDLPYLKNHTHLAIYNDGEYHYYQPYGEVRGITFPFMYDKSTGVPLTMPIADAYGHYDHSSTIDTLYKNPQAFNTPSHINWYNPHWSKVVKDAMVQSVNNYVKSITVDRMMDAIKAPFGKTLSYDSRSAKIELKMKDVYDDNDTHSGSIDFSTLKGLRTLGDHSGDHPGPNFGTYAGSGSSDHKAKIIITEIKTASGWVLKPDANGNFSCINCAPSDAKKMEDAANLIAHQVHL